MDQHEDQIIDKFDSEKLMTKIKIDVNTFFNTAEMMTPPLVSFNESEF